LGGPAKNKKIGGNRVSLADKCPIHPDGNHTWGDCYQNVLNKDKNFPAKGSKNPHRKAHLELKQDVTPCCCCPYPVPQHNEQVVKEEIEQLCEIGVLSICGTSTWLSPLCIIPKKDGRVCWISDFRKLNYQKGI
jgi:hypothetical protein